MSVKKANNLAKAFEKGMKSAPKKAKATPAKCPTCGQVREPGEGSAAEEKRDAAE